LVIFDIVDGEYLGISIATEKAKVLISFVDKMLEDSRHDGSSITLL
jgi:hypothetical protein